MGAILQYGEVRAVSESLNYYSFLGISRSASLQEVARAYDERVTAVYQSGMSKEDMSEAINQCEAAKYWLGDAGRRREYDTEFPSPASEESPDPADPPEAAPRVPEKAPAAADSRKDPEEQRIGLAEWMTALENGEGEITQLRRELDIPAARFRERAAEIGGHKRDEVFGALGANDLSADDDKDEQITAPQGFEVPEAARSEDGERAVTASEAEIRRLRSELDSSTASLREYSIEIKKLKDGAVGEIENLTAAVREKDASIASHQAALRAAYERSQELEAQIAAEGETAAAAMESREREIDRLRQALESSTAALGGRTAEIEDLKRNARVGFEKLAAAVKEKDVNIAALGAKLQAMEASERQREEALYAESARRQELEARAAAEIGRLRQALDERAVEAGELNGVKFEELTAVIGERDTEIAALQAVIGALKETEHQREEALRTEAARRQELEARIAAEDKAASAMLKDREAEIEELRQALEKSAAEVEDLSRSQAGAPQNAAAAGREGLRGPLRPKDIDEFGEYLDDNLKSIGADTGADYYPLLREHLCGVLFGGVPIVIRRPAGMKLMKCVANALTNTADVPTLTFHKGLSAGAAESFLSSGGRVVCLDAFVGRYDEEELLSLFDMHRDKIIFLTIAYNRTLSYVAGEFLNYCHYLNLDRVAAFSSAALPTADPSVCEEEDAPPLLGAVTPDSYLLRDILGELGFSSDLAGHKSRFVFDARGVCRSLFFDILPYCKDVLKISPYNVSERLVKFIDNPQKCEYKRLFMEWFAR